jgi:hypothetical protein
LRVIRADNGNRIDATPTARGTFRCNLTVRDRTAILCLEPLVLCLLSDEELIERFRNMGTRLRISRDRVARYGLMWPELSNPARHDPK